MKNHLRKGKKYYSEEETASLPEMLEEMPEGTNLAVLGESGEPLPLASQEAAEQAQILDPMWCPDGVTPNPAAPSGGCSPTYNTLQDLINGVGVDFTPNKNGTIWVQGGNYPNLGVPILFNANASLVWQTWSTFSLTLQGGWSGGNNKTVDQSNPSIINDAIYFQDWVGAITIRDIVIVPPDPNSGGSFSGLDVVTQKDIKLERVRVKDGNNSVGSMSGAVLNNMGGTGNVIVNDSSFNNNKTDGLVINTNGAG